MFSIGLGANTINFDCKNGYKSWSEVRPFIVSILKVIEQHIERVVRVGVRFTNFFEGLNDLKNFNISFSAGTDQGLIKKSGSVAQAVIKFSTAATREENVGYNVTVANEARVQNKALTGILVDVDAFIDQPSLKNYEQLYECIEYAHMSEKTMFFSLLEKSFLESLEPQY